MNCSYHPAKIDADPDIVGPGATAAFLTSTVVTVITVVCAYLFGALDDISLSALDRKVIASVTKRPRRLKEVTAKQPDDEARLQRVEEAKTAGVTRFILALSDQQLITGLAILIAGIYDPKHLTGYEFNMVAALGWFSSTTHLTTLVAIGPYLNSRGIARDVRAVAMILVVALVSYTVLKSPPFIRSGRPMVCLHDTLDGDGFTMVVNIFIVLGLVSTYLCQIWQLYFPNVEPECLPVLIKLVWRHIHIKGLSRIDFLEEVVSERDMLDLLAIPGTRGPIRHLLLATQYGKSMLSALPLIGYNFSYGLSQLITYRWVYVPNLMPESNRLGFGQLIPVLLLALPAFAAVEALCDYKRACQDDMPLSEKTDDPCTSGSSLSGSELRSKCPDDIFESLHEDSEQFDKNTGQVCALFRREVRLRICNRPADNESEIWMRKSILWRKYERVQYFEAGLETHPLKVMFLTNLVTSILLGALLNLSGFSVWITLVAILLFLIGAFFAVLQLLRRSIDLFRCADVMIRMKEDSTSVGKEKIDDVATVVLERVLR